MNLWSAPPLRGDQHQWHYHFAHVALRMVAFAEPDLTVASLGDEELSQKLIRAILSEVAENYGLDEQQFRVLAGGFKIAVRQCGSRPVYVISMPPTRKAAECHMVAIVLLDDGGIEYFTLERSFKDSTVLCGWNAQGTHLNYGAGPKPEVGAFVAAITALRHA
jgi:hypothetical protein